MSTIQKQKNGRYRARYRDPNGRTRSQTFDRLEDARRFLAGLGGDLLRGEYVDPAHARVRFDYWAETWWASTSGLRPSSRCSYRARLDRHVLPYFSRRRVGSIDFATVELWLADRRQAGLGPKMLRECLSVLSLILAFAVKSKALAQNPAAGHEVRVRRRKVREGDGALTMEQVHQLVAHVRDPYKPAVWLLVFAGLRPAELCGLRVRDVDFVRHAVSVRSTLMPVHGYGDEPWRMVEGPPKTDAGDRTVPIPAWLCDDLAAMLAPRADRNRDTWLFQTRQHNPLHRDHFRENVVLPALRAAGLPATIRTYDLRHSHASLLIDLGANPLAVAQRMGHSDAAFTLRVYGHLFEGVQAKLSDQLDALREKTANSPAMGTLVNLDARRDLTQTGHA
ncbi:MAG: site-specific integrase [Acidimicrobiales bacterium]